MFQKPPPSKGQFLGWRNALTFHHHVGGDLAEEVEGIVLITPIHSFGFIWDVHEIGILVGGFSPTHLKKICASQNGWTLPQVSGVKIENV